VKKLLANKMAIWIKENGFLIKKAKRGKTAKRALSSQVAAL
jgi:hypothetical protein